MAQGYSSKGCLITEVSSLYPKQIMTFQTFALIISLGKKSSSIFVCCAFINVQTPLAYNINFHDTQKLAHCNVLECP